MSFSCSLHQIEIIARFACKRSIAQSKVCTKTCVVTIFGTFRLTKMLTHLGCPQNSTNLQGASIYLLHHIEKVTAQSDSWEPQAHRLPRVFGVSGDGNLPTSRHLALKPWPHCTTNLYTPHKIVFPHSYVNTMGSHQVWASHMVVSSNRSNPPEMPSPRPSLHFTSAKAPYNVILLFRTSN